MVSKNSVKTRVQMLETGSESVSEESGQAAINSELLTNSNNTEKQFIENNINPGFYKRSRTPVTSEVRQNEIAVRTKDIVGSGRLSPRSFISHHKSEFKSPSIKPRYASRTGPRHLSPHIVESRLPSVPVRKASPLRSERNFDDAWSYSLNMQASLNSENQTLKRFGARPRLSLASPDEPNAVLPKERRKHSTAGIIHSQTTEPIHTGCINSQSDASGRLPTEFSNQSYLSTKNGCRKHNFHAKLSQPNGYLSSPTSSPVSSNGNSSAGALPKTLPRVINPHHFESKGNEGSTLSDAAVLPSHDDSRENDKKYFRQRESPLRSRVGQKKTTIQPQSGKPSPLPFRIKETEIRFPARENLSTMRPEIGDDKSSRNTNKRIMESPSAAENTNADPIGVLHKEYQRGFQTSVRQYQHLQNDKTDLKDIQSHSKEVSPMRSSSEHRIDLNSLISRPNALEAPKKSLDEVIELSSGKGNKSNQINSSLQRSELKLRNDQTEKGVIHPTPEVESLESPVHLERVNDKASRFGRDLSIAAPVTRLEWNQSEEKPTHFKKSNDIRMATGTELKTVFTTIDSSNVTTHDLKSDQAHEKIKSSIRDGHNPPANNEVKISNQSLLRSKSHALLRAVPDFNSFLKNSGELNVSLNAASMVTHEEKTRSSSSSSCSSLSYKELENIAKKALYISKEQNNKQVRNTLHANSPLQNMLSEKRTPKIIFKSNTFLKKESEKISDNPKNNEFGLDPLSLSAQTNNSKKPPSLSYSYESAQRLSNQLTRAERFKSTSRSNETSKSKTNEHLSFISSKLSDEWMVKKDNIHPIFGYSKETKARQEDYDTRSYTFHGSDTSSQALNDGNVSQSFRMRADQLADASFTRCRRHLDCHGEPMAGFVAWSQVKSARENVWNDPSPYEFGEAKKQISMEPNSSSDGILHERQCQDNNDLYVNDTKSKISLSKGEAKQKLSHHRIFQKQQMTDQQSCDQNHIKSNHDMSGEIETRGNVDDHIMINVKRTDPSHPYICDEKSKGKCNNHSLHQGHPSNKSPFLTKYAEESTLAEKDHAKTASEEDRDIGLPVSTEVDTGIKQNKIADERTLPDGQWGYASSNKEVKPRSKFPNNSEFNAAKFTDRREVGDHGVTDTVIDDEDDIFFGLEEETFNSINESTNVTENNLSSKTKNSNDQVSALMQKTRVDSDQTKGNASTSFFENSVKQHETSNDNYPRPELVVGQKSTYDSITSDVTSSILQGSYRKVSRFRPNPADTIAEETVEDDRNTGDNALSSHEDHDDDDESVDESQVLAVDAAYLSQEESVNDDKPAAGTLLLNFGYSLVDSFLQSTFSRACHVSVPSIPSEAFKRNALLVCGQPATGEFAHKVARSFEGPGAEDDTSLYLDNDTKATSFDQSFVDQTVVTSMNESERQVWKNWENHDSSTKLTPQQEKYNEKQQEPPMLSSVLDEERIEIRRQAQKQLLVHTQYALQIHGTKDRFHQQADSHSPESEETRPRILEPSEEKLGSQLDTPALLSPEISLEQQKALENFISTLKHAGVEVLKQGRRNKWQIRYLTVSREVSWPNQSSIDRDDSPQCPRALLWLKQFSAQTYSIDAIKGKGRGGVLFSQLMGIELVSTDTLDKKAMPRKYQTSFPPSGGVILTYAYDGGMRELLLCFKTELDAKSFCTSMRVIKEVVDRWMEAELNFDRKNEEGPMELLPSKSAPIPVQ